MVATFLDHSNGELKQQRQRRQQERQEKKNSRFVQSTTFIADTAGTLSKCPHEQESVIAEVYFGQTSIIYFCLGFSCCP